MKKKLLALFFALSLLLCGCAEVLPAETTVSGKGLTVQFLDVGQADCALLECGGEYLLIDGGNRDDSQLVVSFLEQQGVQELSAVVCTHAHEDHVGGLPAVLAVYPTKAVYAPTKTYSSNIFDKFVYYTDQQGLEITIPAPGDQFSLGQAEVTVLGPVKSYAEANNTSIVLRVDYGETVFLFTGDMETDAENDMLDYWEGRLDWQADVLKVGHHGSNTSTGYRFLNAVSPAYGVISVGKGNDYGHPHKEPLSRLRQAGVTILRTDELGAIQAVSDGKEVTFTWANQSAAPENAEAAEQVFIGNKNSKKFHAPDCKNLPAEKNSVEFSSYQQAIDAGYTPCGSCLG
ncbi:MAG: MBL fold metallo-hydrolase [Candidatus Faecousia sp.]|nr:MBL fold metallo-hydrolase [Candidatus Faecousia sp.]